MTYRELSGLDKLTIEVTEDDLRGCMRWSPTSCPIALAVKRTYGIPDGRIGVGGTDIQVASYGDGEDFDTTTWIMDDDAIQFVHDVDHDKPLRTGSFFATCS